MLLLRRLFPLGELLCQVSLSPGLGRGKNGRETTGRGSAGESTSHASLVFLGLAGMLTSANQCTCAWFLDMYLCSLGFGERMAQV